MILPTRKMLKYNFLENKNKELELRITHLERYKENLILEKIELRKQIEQLKRELLKTKYSHVISHKEEGCRGYYYCTESTTENLYAHDGFITVYDKIDRVIILPTSQIINIKKL